ncbi:MAG: AraC family transcriptional regulator [Deltaproteobacteria bacterium]|nr:AraC family transcriptional regulator [Deltaproteobacteria bacterium]
MGESPKKARTDSGLNVSGAWARGVVNAFESLGLDVEALCDKIGIDLGTFTDTSGRPPRDALGRFWRGALAETGDRHLGLSAGEVWPARADHLVILLLTSAETVGEGLEASLRFQELLSHGRVLTLSEHPVYHILQMHKIEHDLPVTVHEVEFLAVIVMKVLRFATSGRFSALEVHFEHPYRGNIQKYTRAFDCSVLFGRQKSAILVDDEAWSLPLTHRNQALHGELRGVASGLHAALDSHAFVDVVRDRIKLLLPRGQSSIEAVAAALHTTPRTLQRRLQDENTSFRALVDAARRSILVGCVERNQAPDEIMRHAGYTNVRSFRRAMKRWNLSDIQ